MRDYLLTMDARVYWLGAYGSKEEAKRAAASIGFGGTIEAVPRGHAFQNGECMCGKRLDGVTRSHVLLRFIDHVFSDDSHAT